MAWPKWALPSTPDRYLEKATVTFLFRSLLTSGLEFGASEEYLEFRFRLLNAAMLTGIFFTLVFIAVDHLGFNHLGDTQLLATEINCALTVLFFVVLRGRKNLFPVVSVAFVAINYATFMSALLLVANDELRVIWFFACLWVTYILIGLNAGVLMTVITMVSLLLANHYLPQPFSRNAMTTLLIALGVTSAIAYAFTSRTLSFFERMNATRAELRELAEKDPLTELLNPRAYYEIANQLIWLARRTGTPYSVLFIDLDHFKMINDFFGHETGDMVLRRAAGCLALHVRHSDVIGRIGGEEFTVFLPETNLEGAFNLGEKLREEVEQLKLDTPDGKPLRITASIGVACDRPSDDSIADIQRRADRMMYHAKHLGRNRVMTELPG